jgi:hypothetical protein
VEKEQRDNLLKVHGKDQSFVDIRMQCLPATEGVNPLNEEFFDAVARLEAGLTQFSDTLGQRD